MLLTVLSPDNLILTLTPFNGDGAFKVEGLSPELLPDGHLKGTGLSGSRNEFETQPLRNQVTPPCPPLVSPVGNNSAHSAL